MKKIFGWSFVLLNVGQCQWQPPGFTEDGTFDTCKYIKLVVSSKGYVGMGLILILKYQFQRTLTFFV